MLDNRISLSSFCILFQFHIITNLMTHLELGEGVFTPENLVNPFSR